MHRVYSRDEIALLKTYQATRVTGVAVTKINTKINIPRAEWRNLAPDIQAIYGKLRAEGLLCSARQYGKTGDSYWISELGLEALSVDKARMMTGRMQAPEAPGPTKAESKIAARKVKLDARQAHYAGDDGYGAF